MQPSKWWQYGVWHEELTPTWYYAYGTVGDKHPLAWMSLPKPYKE